MARLLMQLAGDEGKVDDHTMERVLWYGVLVVVLIFFALFLKFMFQRMKSNSHSEEQTDFTLDDLRKMTAAGQLTQEEFNAAKAGVVERAAAAEKAKPKSKTK